MFRQRYPAAGRANARVELKVLELARRKSPTWTCNWATAISRASTGSPTRGASQCNGRPAIRSASTCSRSKRQAAAATSADRNQPALDRAARRPEVSEDAPAFIWSSRRSGYKHLYLHDLDGKLIRPLTAGEWMVVGDSGESGLVGVDETQGRVYFLANEASPLERQLYSTSLDTRKPAAVRRISREPGWHDAKLLPGGRRLSRSMVVAANSRRRASLRASTASCSIGSCATSSTRRIRITTFARITCRKSSARSKPATDRSSTTACSGPRAWQPASVIRS